MGNFINKMISDNSKHNQRSIKNPFTDFRNSEKGFDFIEHYLSPVLS